MSTIDTFLRMFVRAEWMERAACRGSRPSLFYPERGNPPGHARAVCASCPVRTECADHARNTGEVYGMWGGQSEAERRTVRVAS